MAVMPPVLDRRPMAPHRPRELGFAHLAARRACRAACHLRGELRPWVQPVLRSSRHGTCFKPGGKASAPCVVYARRRDGGLSAWTMPGNSVAGDETATVLHPSFVLDLSATHRVFDTSLSVAPLIVVGSEWMIASPCWE